MIARATPSSLAPCLVVLCLPWLLAGCATKIYQGPTTGRGAEQQQAVAQSADRALRDFDGKPFARKRVVIEVYGLTERLEGLSPEESFIRGALTEKLLAEGAVVVPTRKEAQVLLMAQLDTMGCDVVRRDFPAIYHHTTFEGLTSVRILGLTLEGASATGRLSRQDLAARAVYREAYVFYIFGPITTRFTEPVRAEEAPEEQ